MPRTSRVARWIGSQTLATALGAIAFASALSCGREITGPGAAPLAHPMALQPAFLVIPGEGRVSSGVTFDRVRAVLARMDGNNAIDTLVDFPEDKDSVSLTLAPRLGSAASSDGETMALALRFITSAGDTVFRGGPDTIFVRRMQAGLPPTVVETAVEYVGPGAEAVRVAIASPSATLLAGEPAIFTAQAFDAADALVASAPIVFSSSDTSVIGFANSRDGTATLTGKRGSVQVIASLLTGGSDSATVSVTLPPSQLLNVSGSGQTAVTGSTLANPITVLVAAADGVGVADVAVVFAAADGGSVSVDTVVTDAFGHASTTWTLGTVGGAQSATATVDGLTGSPLTFTATATVVPTVLAFVVEPPPASVAGVIAPSVQVSARDDFGNLATDFVGDVTIALATNPGAATLGGATTVAAVAGVATFTDLQLTTAAVGYTLEATSDGFTPVATAPFTVTPAPAAVLAITSQPADTMVAGDTIAALVIEARDAFGNVATDFTGTLTAALAGNPGTATLGGITSADAVAGVATFDTLVMTRSGSGYTLAFSATGLADAESEPFVITAAAASQIVVTQQPPTELPAGAVFEVVAELRDAFNNVALASTEAVSIALASNPGSATLGGTLTRTPSAGVATFGDLTLNQGGVGYTLSLSAGALTPATTNAITVTIVAAPVGYWRFEGPDFLVSTGSDAPLTPLGSPLPSQLALPLSGRGGRIPQQLSTGANASAAEFAGGSGSGRFTATVQLSQRFTIEAFVHFDVLGGQYAKTIAGFGNPNSSPWAIQVRNAGDFGSSPGEFLIGGGGVMPPWSVNSGVILQPGIDYYLAVAFDIDGTATFWIRDLTNGGALQRVDRTHSITSFPADTRFFIGDLQDGSSDFELDGLIDEVRLSSRVLTPAELLIAGVTFPAIEASRTALNFSGFAGAPGLPGQSVTITNAGDGQLTNLAVGAVTYGGGQPTGWLNVSALNATTAPATFTLTADPSTLAAGTYTATLPVTSTAAGVGSSPQMLTVTYEVEAAEPRLPSRIGAGQAHSCAIATDGLVYCSGRNTGGQLGDGTTTSRTVALPISAPAGVSFTQVSVGSNHNCALTAAGEAYCWGVGSGIGRTTGPPALPGLVEAPAGVTFTQISAAHFITCAIATDGTAYCWGLNQTGEVGDGTTIERLTPVPVAVPSGVTFVEISASWTASCALTASGAAYCWGFNRGNFGDGTRTSRLTPTRVASPDGVAFRRLRVSGGGQTCAIAVGGSAYCWGQNGVGQLGDGTTTQRLVPTPVLAPAGVRFTELAVGTDVFQGFGGGPSCAVTTTGALYCWGGNESGQLGDGTTTNRTTPVGVPGPVRTQVTTGGTHSCSLAVDGSTGCWGANGFGQLGDGTTTQRLTPVAFGVLAPPALALSQSLVAFEGAPGGSAPAAQTVSILNAATGALNGLALGPVTYADGEPTGWLTVGSLSSTTAPATVSLTASPAALPAGTYTATVTVTSSVPGVTGSPREITVRLVVSSPAVSPVVATLGAGNTHTCEITATGAIRCAGDNASGQLGDGTVVPRPAPVLVAAPLGATFTQVTTGDEHTCALTAAGESYCWGNNELGQLGDGTQTNRLTPVLVAVPAGFTFVQLSAGSAHTCGLTPIGAAYCWGNNSVGTIGDGTLTRRLSPTAVSGARTYTQLVTGYVHSCGLTPAGEGYCWGQGGGRLGNGTTAFSSVPVRVAAPPGVTFASLAAGRDHGCGLTPVGTAYCWGANTFGQLGDATTSVRTSPVVVQAPAGVTFGQLAPGGSHTCGITIVGAAYCWGQNTSGQLADGTILPRTTPAPISGGAPFAQITSRANHTCARTPAGVSFCWGANFSGQLGDGTTATRASIVEFGDLAPAVLLLSTSVVGFEGAPNGGASAAQIVSISNGGAATLADLALSAVTYTAGEPTGWLTLGALSGTTAPATFSLTTSTASLSAGTYTASVTVSSSAPGVIDPSQVVTVRLVVSGAAVGPPPLERVGAGDIHTCVLLAGGLVACAGENAFGQLGDGTLVPRATAQSVAAPAGVEFVQVSTSSGHSCGVTTTGAAYCWGLNSSGQLGDGTLTNRSTPTLVSAPGLTFSRVAAGGGHTCALTSTGSVYCWGSNFDGQLGDGSQTQRLTPVPAPVPAGAPFVQVAAGASHSCALRSSGLVYCWGRNESGQLGDSTITRRLNATLIQAPAGVSFTQLAAAASRTCAVTTEGAAYCWGANASGQIGDGSTTQRLVPTAVAIPAGVSFAQIATATNHSCATSTDGAAYCWGANSQFQLGDGTSTPRLTPRRVALPAGVTATLVATGGGHSCAASSTDDVYCWGWNLQGQLSDGSTISRAAPVLFVPPAATIQLSASTRSFAIASGAGAPPSQSVSITNSGGGALTSLEVGPISFAAGEPTGWLELGTLSSTTAPATFSLTVSPGSLTPGTYTATVPVTSTAANVTNSPQELTVTFVLDPPVVPDLTSIAAGGSHSCALGSGGSAYCAGANSNGQLGDGTTTNRALPVSVAGVSLVQVATGASHSCGLTAAGVAYCWGLNASGQLGDASLVTRATPAPVLAPAGVLFAQVTVGSQHSCGVSLTGTAYCWGTNGFGHLGDGTTTLRTSPVPVAAPAGITFTRLAAGNSHSCGLTPAGAVYCWGFNSGGQLGDGSTTTRTSPVQVVAAGLTFEQVATGVTHSCARTSDGTAYCWGANTSGQLGDGSTTARNTPVPVLIPGGGPVAQIGSGGNHSCARTPAGSVYCWGLNSSAQLGDGSTTTSAVPVTVALPAGVAFVQLSTGNAHNCGLTASAQAYCWGSNAFGQHGDGNAAGSNTPIAVVVPAGVTFDQVTAGSSHSCGVQAAGSAYCWGLNSLGQLGDGSTVNRSTATAVATPAGVSISQIAAYGGHTCGLSQTGEGFCWGFNGSGQVGDGSTTNRSAPVPVAFGGTFLQVATSGVSHSCAVTSDGAVGCWGLNSAGQLGDGTTTARSMPVPVNTPAGLSFTQVATGSSHSCALTDAGAAYCWGLNSSGQLGDATLTQRLTPVPVAMPAGVTFTQIAVGQQHSCGLTPTGAVYCWGSNLNSRLGDGTTTNRNAPVPLAAPAGVTFTQVAAGSAHGCAVTAAGQAYCWGFNNSGQIGDGSTTTRGTPELVTPPAGVSFSQLATGASHSCAVTPAGAAYCWGLNSSGQLGDGYDALAIRQFQLP